MNRSPSEFVRYPPSPRTPSVINTPARDYSPRISGDGKWFLYTSERFDHQPDLPLTYESFVRMSRGLYNGLGNLYRVPMEYVLRTTKP